MSYLKDEAEVHGIDRNEEMCLLRSIGVAPQIIAEVFGLSYGRVVQLTYGLEPPKKDWSLLCDRQRW